MSDYVLTYYGEPTFESPEAGAGYMAAWQKWVEGLGDALINPGLPLGKPTTVSSRGLSNTRGSDRLTGFSIVQTETIEAAIDLAKRCPHLEHGTIDVSEAMPMQM